MKNALQKAAIAEDAGGPVYYEDDSVKITLAGVKIMNHFYPAREIRKIYLRKIEQRFTWIRMLICAALLLPAIAMSADFLGKGPVGFLVIVSLTAPLLAVGGGAVFGLFYPAYALHFQTLLYDSSVLESRSLPYLVTLKKAGLQMMRHIAAEDAYLEKTGKILNFF